MTTPAGARVGVIGCGRGELVIALAQASPAVVVAGFDPDPAAIAVARRAAAMAGVADRVTFEVASRGVLHGDGYDLIYMAAGVPAVERPCTSGDAEAVGGSNVRA